MKKIFVVAGLVLFTSITASAAALPHASRNGRKEQKQERKELRMAKREQALTEPMYQTQQQFERDFPKATHVTWSRSEFEKASFLNEDGLAMSAFYDYENNLVGTTFFTDYSVIPEKAQKAIAKAYGGYTVGPVVMFDDNENNETDMLMFGTPFENRDNYFIELKKEGRKIIVESDMAGNVSWFREL
jgi:hypothetical protein